LGYIDGIHVTIYIAYMDPMGYKWDEITLPTKAKVTYGVSQSKLLRYMTVQSVLLPSLGGHLSLTHLPHGLWDHHQLTIESSEFPLYFHTSIIAPHENPIKSQ
jgi:hypothetical protein